jgi:hypothetical protein
MQIIGNILVAALQVIKHASFRKKATEIYWMLLKLQILTSHTCIFASNPVWPAASMFSEPAISTSINLPPTDGTSKII